MNNITNKIGCQANGLKIVDPNKFDGMDSSSNMSVATEDLNISVVLRTRKKGRTVLTKEPNFGTVESTNNITINFIEGSKINGEKVLTTKYTDLTTVFDKNVFNDETLGITNIDIDFNSAMAPMITINFVDVRGSSIFQNEENISGNNTSNKYSTFLQLPYPIFELEIKGYYGKPVTYCLHMLKFNSKFNSKSGNFEIQCEFIGYTYAMLSDMLIGFLKAIPYTKLGGKIYENYKLNSETPEKIVTLVELMRSISKINEGIQKISSSSQNSINNNVVTDGLEKLKNIKSTINFFGKSLTTNKNDVIADDYKFIVSFDDLDTTDEVNTNTYKKDVEKLITEFNGFNIDGIQLNLDYFTSLIIKTKGKGFYSGITKLSLKTPNQTLSSEVQEFNKALLDFLDKNYPTITDDKPLNVYDMNGLFDKIEETNSKLERYSEKIKKDLALELKDSVREDLGFDPTVRNIVEVFTASIEVFMEAIYTISSRAENPNINKDRIEQLKKKFNSELTSTDIKKQYLDANKYFAWPDYRERDEKRKTYVEKYLGSEGVLDNPSKVDEIEFIDDLLNGFLSAQTETNQVISQSSEESTTWFPINPLDTKIFEQTEPYGKQLITPKDVARVALIRGMTFLGYTNNENFLSKDEIVYMAQIEAEAIFRGVKDKNVKDSLGIIDLKYLTELTGVINNVNENIINLRDKNYVYNYIYTKQINGPSRVIIPINDTFEGNWPTLNQGLIDKADSGSIFLTNYSNDYGFINKKTNDGGKYVLIKKPSELPTESLVTTTAKIDTNIDFNLNKLQSNNVDISAGYNSLGSPLGIQEYINMNFGSDLKLPLRYVFYSDSDNGLAFNRVDSGEENFKKKNISTTSYYDLKKDGYQRVDNKFYGNRVYKDRNNEDEIYIHCNLGKNRPLFSKFLDGKTNLTYPYIELKLYDGSPFSLFGSQWYYFQDKSKCVGIIENGIINTKGTVSAEQYVKASLFLNTLPFNISDGDPFGNYEISNLFDKKGGLIHAPRLWCAYIGSILWRINDGKDVDYPIVEGGKIVGGGSGVNDPFIWDMSKTKSNSVNNRKFIPPTRKQYLPKVLDVTDIFDFVDYSEIDENDIIINLPQQVKDEFKKIFFDFVNDGDGMVSWNTIRNSLEIWGGDSETFPTFIDSLLKSSIQLDKPVRDYYVLSNNVTQKVKNSENYKIITPSIGLKGNDFMFLELKGDYTNNSVIKNLIDALNEELIIVNNSYKIWVKPTSDENKSLYGGVSVSETIFNDYFNSLISKIAELKTESIKSNSDDKLKQTLFGTTNTDFIKLMLYRTCKNIHDKWLAGVDEANNVMYPCGGVLSRNSVDSKLAIRYNNKTPKFIDTFRFVSRSFKDIGNDLYINPIPINEYLINNVNSGAYDVISSMLAKNNFDFIALPNFINYRNDSEVEAIFKPFGNYGEAITKGSCGPSFVCVYVGERSKHLDFSNSEYSNDGIDFRCNNGGVDLTRVPDDFTENLNDYEDGLAVFTVKYSQQNQNIFKDIELDQNEFTETNESLQIQDDISQKGSETNRTIAGQNIFNVYSVRSYTANIEMMGNAMIQPMMYFQLDNIPMFHGGYMITRVRHKIQPNTMNTTFTGVRVKFTETPLVTALDVYMSLVDALDTTSAGTGPISLGNSGNFVDKYYFDLQNNKPKDTTIIGSLTNVSKKAITIRAEKEIKNWENGQLKEENAISLLNKYASETPGFKGSAYANDSQPWSAIFISYIALAGDINFPKSTSHYDYITSGMNGFLGYEVFPLNFGLKIKAEVGDIINNSRQGGYTASHSRIIYKIENEIAYLVGGNESNSIKISQINLTDGFITDKTNVDGYLLLMKQTNNKYYKKKKLISSGDYSENSKIGCPKISTTIKNQSSYKNNIEKLLNGTYKCSSGRKCKESFEGFKQVKDLYNNGIITKKGIIGLTQGLLEGFGSSPERRNPGNIRSGNSGFKIYDSWKEGWQAYSDTYLTKWVNGSVTPTKSAQYPDCYSSLSNQVFKTSGVKFTDKKSYNYISGSPTLRQYTNIYAPWGDNNNPSNYCAVIAKTLKDYGVDINIDDNMNTWV